MTTLHQPTAASKTLLNALSHPRRRLILSHLANRGGPHSLDDLAGVVARVEQRIDTGREASEKAIKTDLWHVHLPRLEAVDLVESDSDGESVSVQCERDSLGTSLDRFSALTSSLDALDVAESTD